ncbi:hypothetical protein FGO68_gene9606 [Halteria grandinella]|uniref:Uncharacterized protein n=1 Tax=Halteria grandinella TaxID=5974 RepID=A0A8J8NYM7_HALGN|nr:hypothetical protein FGO68_gene9606 [Halteria grandinella]
MYNSTVVALLARSQSLLSGLTSFLAKFLFFHHQLYNQVSATAIAYPGFEAFPLRATRNHFHLFQPWISQRQFQSRSCSSRHSSGVQINCVESTSLMNIHFLRYLI